LRIGDREIAVAGEDLEAVLLHRRAVGAARHEHHLVAVGGKARPEVAADRAGAGDQDLHQASAWQARLMRAQASSSSSVAVA